MITKDLYTYSTKILRQEKILRDHGANESSIRVEYSASCCYQCTSTRLGPGARLGARARRGRRAGAWPGCGCVAWVWVRGLGCMRVCGMSTVQGLSAVRVRVGCAASGAGVWEHHAGSECGAGAGGDARPRVRVCGTVQGLSAVWVRVRVRVGMRGLGRGWRARLADGAHAVIAAIRLLKTRKADRQSVAIGIRLPVRFI